MIEGKNPDGKPRSRYIKKEIADEVNKKYGFRCAWDGVQLTEKHHIVEFAEGGSNEVDNLILLCPTCHAQVHKGEITLEQILERKTTFKQADRFGGNLFLSQEDPVFRMGTFQYNGSERLIVVNDMDVFSYKLENNVILLKTEFYDAKGNLFFWMSSNRFWSIVEFEISNGADFLEIKSKDDEVPLFFRLVKKENILHMFGNFYLKNVRFEINEKQIIVDERILEGYGGLVEIEGAGLFINSPKASKEYEESKKLRK